jgi:hypothetical protein
MDPYCQVKSNQSHIATDDQSISKSGVEPHLGPITRYLLLFDSYGLVFVGRPLWREDGSVICTCCWSLPAQSYTSPSPLGLATIFYCLKFETFLFIASYDLQGHGGCTRPRLHTGISLSLSLSLSRNASWPWHEPHKNTASNSYSIVACYTAVT